MSSGVPAHHKFKLGVACLEWRYFQLNSLYAAPTRHNNVIVTSPKRRGIVSPDNDLITQCVHWIGNHPFKMCVSWQTQQHACILLHLSTSVASMPGSMRCCNTDLRMQPFFSSAEETREIIASEVTPEIPDLVYLYIMALPCRPSLPHRPTTCQ